MNSKINKPEEDKQKISAEQATEFMRDYMELQLHFAQLPLELAKVRNLIDEMRFHGGSGRYNVFVVIYRMMDLLNRNQKPTMGDISRAISLPLSTTTRMVDLMVEIGDCMRMDDPEDRRLVRVTLTEQGRNNLRTSREYVAERGQKILSTLTPQERQTFLSLFDKVAVALRHTEDLT